MDSCDYSLKRTMRLSSYTMQQSYMQQLYATILHRV